MRKVFIYTLAHPTTNEIRYVGRAFDLKKRYANHLCIRTQSHTQNWVKNLKINGLLPKMEILDECSELTWESCEQYWVSQFKSWGFDLTNHHEGGRGPIITSKQLKNRVVWSKGKRLSEEIKRKMSEGAKKRDHSYKIGRKQSQQTIEKRISTIRNRKLKKIGNF